MAAATIDFIDLKAQQARIRREIDAAITRVLDHGQYIMGPEVKTLEKDLAAFTGAKHAISCASGTDALLIAMMAKGIGPGDAVLCPAFTYTATPETIALIGASPVFVDVEDGSFNLDVKGLEAGIAAAKTAGLTPRAIIAVDLFGQPAAYDAIRAFADAHKLWILADAAQSFGATLQGKTVGTLGDITATSFFPAKPLGCYGDGGAIFVDDDGLAKVMDSIRLHGKGEDKYDIVRIGINGRLDTIQAAILIEKLKIFKDEIAARNAVAQRFTTSLRSVVTVPEVRQSATSVWAQYTLQVPADRRAAIAASLKAAGVPTQIYYPRPVPAQEAYAKYPVASGGVPVSDRLSREVLSLPMHPYLDEATQDRIISAVKAAVA
ncbi:MAG: DegT/DnrJ/EryC1/StrS family aminotransferase [Proteobacteria bacterium]|nr:DegT/DnrJ/EryC1/StrS family aminotransferase [Pseudomonadota bacterium]